MELVLSTPVARVIELAVLESEIPKRPRWLQSPLHIANSVIGPLAMNNVLLPRKSFLESLLLLRVVSVQFPIDLGVPHWAILLYQYPQRIASVAAVDFVVVNHAHQRTRTRSCRLTEAYIHAKYTIFVALPGYAEVLVLHCNESLVDRGGYQLVCVSYFVLIALEGIIEVAQQFFLT